MLYMHFKRDKINMLINKITANPEVSNNTLTLQILQSTVLEDLITKHDKKIMKIYSGFKQVDEDQDGIIDPEALNIMVSQLDDTIDIDQLLRVVDWSGKGVITFSGLV